jgi:hypothetical protein
MVFYKGIGFLNGAKTIAIISVTLVIPIMASKQVIERFSVETTTNFEKVLHKEKFNRVYLWTGTSIRLL